MPQKTVKRLISGLKKDECESCDELKSRLLRELDYDKALRNFSKDLIIENDTLKGKVNWLRKRYTRALRTNAYLKKQLRKYTKKEK